MYLIHTAHCTLGAEFSSETFDLYLEFIKFTVGKTDLRIQVVSNILKYFQITELSVSF